VEIFHNTKRFFTTAQRIYSSALKRECFYANKLIAEHWRQQLEQKIVLKSASKAQINVRPIFAKNILPTLSFQSSIDPTRAFVEIYSSLVFHGSLAKATSDTFVTLHAAYCSPTSVENTYCCNAPPHSMIACDS